MDKRHGTIPDDAEHPDRDMELGLRLEPVGPDPAARTSREPSRRTSLAVLAKAVSTFRRTAVPSTRVEWTVRWFASRMLH